MARSLSRGEGKTQKIPIVEDNEPNMKLFRDLLEAHDYETHQSRDGQESLSICRSVMPMDINCRSSPVWMDVAEALKADDDLEYIPIIAVTTSVMKDAEEKICEGGCDAYLSKPISLTSFVETVETP